MAAATETRLASGDIRWNISHNAGNERQWAIAARSPAYLRNRARVMSGETLGAADAEATGNIFLQSQLNKPDTKLHMPSEGHTAVRDMPMVEGGGWVDTETSEFVDVFSPPDAGTGSNTNDIRRLKYNRSQTVYPTNGYGVQTSIGIIELMKCLQANKSPMDILAAAVKTDFEKNLDRRVYIGRDANQGLLNSVMTGVTNQAAANGATTGTPAWATKAPIEIFNDFNNAASITWNKMGNALNAIPNHFTVPASRWNYLLQPMYLGTTAGTTVYENVLKYIEGNYFGLSINGRKPTIVPLPFWAETIGTGNTAQLTSYVFDHDFLSFSLLQKLQRVGGPLSLQAGEYVMYYMANTGIVKVLRPQALMYQYGI